MIFRALTYTIDFDNFDQNDFNRRLNIIRNLIPADQKIRTLRVNTIPIKKINSKIFLTKLKQVLNFINQNEIRWLNISFDLSDKSKFEISEASKISLKILKEQKNVFINWIYNGDNIVALDESCELILNISRLNSSGYDNFRFGVSCNILPNTPFFPFSYGLKENEFSIAVETINSFISNFSVSKDYNETFNMTKKELLSFQKAFDRNKNFKGFDLSFAPFPDENVSIVDLYKKLGLSEFGSLGTTYITSELTAFLKKFVLDQQLKTCGFNGVMFSLLEDKLLVKENNFKTFTINDFLLYSTVCGCGIDMVPVPGNILPEQLRSLILDTHSISNKYKKPLGVRILPIPNKKENEFTQFDMEFIENTRVIGIPKGYF